MEILSLQTHYTEAISKALDVLKSGGLIIFPTETTYGAGVDALNQAAVSKLLAYKARREGKPLSIAVTDQQMAEKYVELSDSAKKLYRQFLPGPVTVVSKGKGQVAKGVESEFGTLGVRIPNFPFVLELLEKLKRPMTATSANASGEKRPYTIQDIFDHLTQKQKGLIDLVLDAGELPHNPPSTVIDTTLSAPVVFRQGNIVTTPAAQTKLLSASDTETQEIAQRIMLKNWSAVKKNGFVIGLNGSLGAGKTTFAKGVAQFLHIHDVITSPTYTYREDYPFDRHGVKGQFIHFDVWKIETPQQLDRLGLADLLRQNTVVVIEWVDIVAPHLRDILANSPSKYLEIAFREEAGRRILSLSE